MNSLTAFMELWYIFTDHSSECSKVEGAQKDLQVQHPHKTTQIVPHFWVLSKLLELLQVWGFDCPGEPGEYQCPITPRMKNLFPTPKLTEISDCRSTPFMRSCRLPWVLSLVSSAGLNKPRGLRNSSYILLSRSFTIFLVVFWILSNVLLILWCPILLPVL